MYVRPMVRRIATALTLAPIVAGDAIAQGPPVGEARTIREAVEYDRGSRQSWSAAARGQVLFVSDSLRTGRSGKADVGFSDNSWCKLSPGLTLTVRDPLTRRLERDPQADRVALLCSNNTPATFQTFAASVDIRGTEFVLEVFNDRTVLTVVEGSAILTTTVDSIVVNAREEGTARPGEAPTKRLLLNPDDAVQWALSYPTEFPGSDRPLAAVSAQVRGAYQALAFGNTTAAVDGFQAALAGTLPEQERAWARIGLSSAYQRLNRLADAQQLMDDPVPAGLETERLAQRAAVALDLGDVARAREEVQRAIAADARAVRPLVLLATIELTQNRKTEARAAVDRALAADPKSAAANRAASEVAQAFFELDRAIEYIDRALARDPDYVPALVNRAGLRFGTGDIARAKQDAAHAASIAPNDPLVRSLSGFIRLADGDVDAAEQDFAAAALADAGFGDPHLGLGLVRFQQGRLEEGVVEFRNAAAAEPRVSLFQSYLGKAHYQTRRFADGLKAIETAKRLDPQDPTPWLYESFFRRDQNRQVEALRALYEAMARNDNRAVYRSRLLLDRDLATGSVSLAEVYRQLGFEALGAAEATDSLAFDTTNASAHLFLANSFLSRGDRLQAGSSERLQYFLYAPVNRNMFFTASPTTGLNEYTTLLDSPWRQFSVEGTVGDRSVTSAISRSGNRRFAHVALADYDRERGAMPERRDKLSTLFVQGKVGLRPATDFFFQATVSDSDSGEQEEQPLTVNLLRFDPFTHFRLVDDRNTVNTTTIRSAEGIAGFRHEWFPGSTTTAAFQIERIDPASSVPQVIDLDEDVLRVRTVLERPERSLNVQVQQVIRTGRQQFTIGVEAHRTDKEMTDRLMLDEPDFDELTAETVTGEDRDAAAWFRADLRPWAWAHVTAGARYSDTRYFEPAANLVFEAARWQPMVGLSLRMPAGIVARAAAFRQVNSNFLSSRLSPTTIEGFVLDRNDLPATVRDEFNLSVEVRRWNAFHSVHGFHQAVESGLADLFDVAEPARRTGIEYLVNQVLARRWTFFAGNQLARTEPLRSGSVQGLLPVFGRLILGLGLAKDQYVRWDNRLQLGVNFIHERGWFVRARHTTLAQRFTDTLIADLEDATYHASDADVGYEFADKRGLINLQMRNVFDRRFVPFVDTFLFGLPEVRRQVSVSVRWRF